MNKDLGENEQRRSELRLGQFLGLLNLSSDSIVILDQTHRILFWNGGSERMYGWSADEAAGRNIHDLLSTRFPKRLDEIEEEFRATQRWEGELTHTTRAGKTKTIQSRWVLDTADGGRGVILESNTDVTDQKTFEGALLRERDAAEIADRAKSVFLANMSHEIRTPLGAILGFTDLLLDSDGDSTEDRKMYGEIIRRNAELLRRLIDDVLDFSRIEAGRSALEKRRFSLLGFMAEIAASFRDKVRDRGLDFKVLYEAPLPESIVSDPARLRQILSNVIGNAIKFTDEGGIVLKVKSDYETNQIVFLVKDTGAGIPPEKHSALFQPFTQVDDTTSRRFGGTGLGLALSRQLARALGGDIRIQASGHGEGSTFQVSVRAEGAKTQLQDPVGEYSLLSDAGVSWERPPERPVEQELRNVRVLLVEDTVESQILVKRMLSPCGARVDLADNGEEGIEKALDQNYDVVLMDLEMPSMDGFEATSKLRQWGFEKPILALSAHAMPDERERSLKSGCNSHIAKPIDKNTLIREIAKAVGLQRVH